MIILIELFLSFLKIGTFTFGGGYAMASLLRDTAVAHGWLTESGFADILAISNVTPGPIAVNMATFVGYNQAGIAGAFAATLGVALPSFTFVMLVMRILTKFKQSKHVENIFNGLRPAVVGLIAATGITFALEEFFPNAINIDAVELRSAAIFVVAFVAIYKFKINPVVIIISAAVVGIFIF